MSVETNDICNSDVASTSNDDALSNFVTVVSIGSEMVEKEDPDDNSGYVTVVQIGQTTPEEIIEEVLVYRLPGERLGFGLKFEGGTKAAEFVQRLFIQSCAPDSPASMVHCSWGQLTEGDEVLNIDSCPVTNMTRIDCVRSLKDSNVVIKLLVRHFNTKSCQESKNKDNSARLTEDLPHVISAEKKRTPPPPPPVPPRKIPRKMLRSEHHFVPESDLLNNNDTNNNNTHDDDDINNNNSNNDNNIYNYNCESIRNGLRGSKFQSPRSSMGLGQPLEVSRYLHRDKHVVDGSAGAPDAQVYLDLFSNESGYCLSESDDTSSSISTIIDRFSSFPTTTNSSFAGSLPSTPTSVQKKLDILNILQPFDKNELDTGSRDNYLFTKLVASQNGLIEANVVPKSSEEKLIKYNNEVLSEEGMPLQPPTSFQDAPLSYGNEDVGILKGCITTEPKLFSEIADENGNCLKNIAQIAKNKPNNKSEIKRRLPPPPPPPVKKQELPRLVNFVSKCSTTDVEFNVIESVKLFLQSEIQFAEELSTVQNINFLENTGCVSVLNDDITSEIYNAELYNLNWSISPPLATIGEDDEEASQESYTQKSLNISTPIVIIENADTEKNEVGTTELPHIADKQLGFINDEEHFKDEKNSETESLVTVDTCESMEIPPSSSRQPPDGDEFPDYHEATITPKSLKTDVTNKIPFSWINNKEWKTSSSLLFRDQQSSYSVRDKIAMFSNAFVKPTINTNLKVCKSTDDILSALEKEKLRNQNIAMKNTKIKRSVSVLCKINSIPIEGDCNKPANTFSTGRTKSVSDLCNNAFLTEEKPHVPTAVNHKPLHTRSQSLIDIASTNQMGKKDRWNLLAEQRQKTLSKLKGLIIPERVVETDISNIVDLPEIKSNDAVSCITTKSILPIVATESSIVSCQRNLRIPNLTTSTWSYDNTSTIHKYSPAFNTRNLQLHRDDIVNDIFFKTNVGEHTPIKSKQIDNKSPIIENQEGKINNNNNNLYVIDAPKSLESITSPTRSDCSFDYVSSSPDMKASERVSNLHKANFQVDTQCPGFPLNKGKDIVVEKSEDESDNDSAVSSSQSSYISKLSPPTSPNNNNFTSLPSYCIGTDSEALENYCSQDPYSVNNQNHRLLKPQSVEAINRKNILASAKCRSGRDLKIGSPLIQRKFEEELQGIKNVTNDKTNTANNNHGVQVEGNEKCVRTCSTIYEIVDSPMVSSEGAQNETLPENGDAFGSIPQCKIEEKLINVTNSENYKIFSPKFLPKNLRSTNVTDLRKSFENVIPLKSSSISANIISSTKKRASTVVKNDHLHHNEVNHNLIKNDTHMVIDTEIVKEAQGLEIIALRPEIPGGSVGITLAGGADYENKEITIYKIRGESAAHLDGRLHKGDKIVRINGKSVEGLTHKQLVSMLKEPLAEITLTVCKQQKGFDSISTASAITSSSKEDAKMSPIGTVSVITLMKDAAGLGFSLEGGQDSTLGNLPLLIKKIFIGGAAEKCGNLYAGDELLFINETDVSVMSRFEAWSLLKKLPEGIIISLTIRR